MPLIKKADECFLTQANGKTLFTVDLAKKFGFREDYDKDGSVNQTRYEGSKPFKEMILRTLPQYDMGSPLPTCSDTNNEGFADLFPGVKSK